MPGTGPLRRSSVAGPEKGGGPRRNLRRRVKMNEVRNLHLYDRWEQGIGAPLGSPDKKGRDPTFTISGVLAAFARLVLSARMFRACLSRDLRAIQAFP